MSKTFLRTPTRQYNDLEDRESYFIKSSHFADKIHAEARFYEDLPQALKCFYPKFLGMVSDGRYPFGYSIEKIPASDASLHNVAKVQSSAAYIPTLLSLLKGYLEAVPKKSVSDEQWQQYVDKLIIQRDQRRLQELGQHEIISQINQIYAEHGYGDAHGFMSRLHKEIEQRIKVGPQKQVWASHGDLCLSNIIVYEGRIFLIDPRGKNSGEDGYLIPHYDLAKLSQCLIGSYDHIHHSTVRMKEAMDHSPLFQEFLNGFGIELKQIRLIESSHFLAMLPLHLPHPEKVMAFARQSIQTFEESLAL